MSFGELVNVTAIGQGAIVDNSNKIRLGKTNVTVIDGQVAFTAVSDKTKKENFQPVDGEEVLGKIRGFELSSWNFIGHDPKEFRHYGPIAQDFFAAFGHDGLGQIGSETTTINSGDMAGILMIAVKALEKCTAIIRIPVSIPRQSLFQHLTRLERTGGVAFHLGPNPINQRVQRVLVLIRGAVGEAESHGYSWQDLLIAHSRR